MTDFRYHRASLDDWVAEHGPIPITVTATVTYHEQEPTVSENPYDRRVPDGARLGKGEFGDILVAGMSPGGRLRATPFETRATHGLAIDDLDAIAFNAHARGQQAAAERLERRHEEEVQRARRNAWAEGQGAGYTKGQRALLTIIAEQFDAPTNDLRNRLADVFDGLDPKVAWDAKKKVQAMDLICEARDMLAKLIDAHHNDFCKPKV